MFLKNKTIKNELTGSGLYIDKASLPLIVCLSMLVVCAMSNVSPAIIPEANLNITYFHCTVLGKLGYVKHSRFYWEVLNATQHLERAEVS